MENWAGELVRKFREKFKSKIGREATPLDFAANLPISMSESDTMTAMAQFMKQGRE